MEGTFWALIPTLAAVIISLLTKEVYLSLLVGIITGALLISHNPIEALSVVFDTMAQQIGATGEGLGNAGILIFIVELGLLVALMNKSGGTEAISYRIASKVRSDKGALLATGGLGCLIFMDDYFNRLAVGTIMKPVADRFDISRIKLAQYVCAISVSVCILVPISSWASAITGNIGEGMDNAFNAYLKTLTCNFYPILTLIFLFVSPLIGAKKTKKQLPVALKKPNGKAIDLILPITALVISSILLMTEFTSETALAIGGAIALMTCFALYLPRKVMSLRQFTSCFSDGVSSIGDVIMILVLAWTLTGICEKLEIGTFIVGVTSSMGNAKAILPAVMFVAAMGTAFATGTAWGTFGMLVPLAVPMFEPFSTLQILTISAVLSGAVFGNQASPISDSTLLASSICECNHIEFIHSQLPNLLAIAASALMGFLVSGLSGYIWAGWIAAFTVFIAILAAKKLKISLKKPQNAHVQ